MENRPAISLKEDAEGHFVHSSDVRFSSKDCVV